MSSSRARLILLAAALTLSTAGAALGSRRGAPPAPASERPLERVDPFALAEILARAPPDDVVVALDAPKHPLRGALPAAAFGKDDEAFLAQAPRARRVILAGADPVRVDRLARRLLATGRRAAFLQGGVQAWDRAMDADPPAPPATAPAADLRRHRGAVALRRSFGDAAAAPPPLALPAPGALAPPSGSKKKREGC